MSLISTASTQWATRPADQRFTSLTELQAFTSRQHSLSEAYVRPNRALEFTAIPDSEHKGLRAELALPNRFRGQVDRESVLVDPTHWSFGQLAQLAGAPAGYLRSLPSELTADNLNWGLSVNRDVEEIGMFLRRDENGNEVYELAAATGPNYGRIYNDKIVGSLVRNFGNGVDGDWRVPGEFGVALEKVTKENTTFYASDRDMFVFLTDEKNKIEVPNRRDGKSGLLSRGFYVWNSEVGSASFGIASFLFDYVCQNRNIWGATEFSQITMRHSSGAPDRFLNQVAPLLSRYAESSEKPVVAAIAAAQAKKVDDVADFLAKRKFSKGQIAGITKAHTVDENRPMETIFDVSNGITAYARSIDFQNDRVALERKAGEIFALAA